MSTASLPDLYAAHLKALVVSVEESLQACGFDALVISAGKSHTYFQDDQEVPFRTNPYFAYFLPLKGPRHFLYLAKGKKPLLVAVFPEDYWYEQESVGDAFWKDAFEIKEVESEEEAWKEIPADGSVAFISESLDGGERGINADALNPEKLLARLNWKRSFKTEYESFCIEEANHLAAHSHERAREAFFAGASELEIHEAYLEQLGETESGLPYPTIVAMNEKASILHYQNKRLREDGKVLLLDAGASYQGYASDITRTFLAENCDVLFAGLVGGVDTLQRELCELAKPGVSFPLLHHIAHVKIGELLHSLDILKLKGEDSASEGITRTFFPHGLGHFLGIQVHDVGGDQEDADGNKVKAPLEYPTLRMTRTISEGNVFTIEPGVYFIPSLLKKSAEGANKEFFNWPLIERLTPFGGVRIEDDILATKEGNKNLTRQYI